MVKWYDRGLQNLWREFDSLIPCLKSLGNGVEPLFFKAFVFIKMQKVIERTLGIMIKKKSLAHMLFPHNIL